MELQWQEWVDSIGVDVNGIELSDESIGMIVCAIAAACVLIGVVIKGGKVIAGAGRSGRGRERGWSPSRALFAWSDTEAFTCEDSYSGCLITGQTGGGKTTGSGARIAESFLRAGYGGLVLLVKNDWAYWEELCRRTGRLGDLVKFSPSEPWRFNFLDFELSRKGRGAGQVENIVNLLMTTMETVERNNRQGGGREGDNYWQLACQQLCRNLVELAAMSIGRINIRDLYRIVASIPGSLRDAKSVAWMETSFCAQCLNQALQRCPKEKKEDLLIVLDFFTVEYPQIHPKTRKSIDSTFSVMADSLQRGVLRDLFGGVTNITPQAIEAGRIVVVDMPLVEFGAIGALASGLWKFGFQRSIEQRDIKTSPRPVFLWSDEAQFLITSVDHSFLSTCRSSRVATVYLTQSVSSFFAALGGQQKSEAEVNTLVGNLCTKIFHCNGDSVTNKWASEMIGLSRQMFRNSSNSYQSGDWLGAVSGMGQGPQMSSGMSEQMQFEVPMSVYPRLRTGGHAHQGHIDAVVFAAGRIFRDTGKPWRFATFRQRL